MRNSVNYRKPFAVVLCLVAAAAPSYGIVSELGHVETTLSVRGDYDSNIFLNNRDVSDFITTASAQAKFVRDVALVATEVSIGASYALYADHSEQKSLDPYVRGQLAYTPSDKTTVNGGISFQRDTLANDVLNTRTKSNDFNFNGSLQHLFSEKLGYRVLGDYRDDKYLTAGYADVLDYSAGADAVYVYSPKLTVVGGYTHRESWTANRAGTPAGSPASKDDRYSVGFEGELAPKVSGTFSIGVVQRRFDAAGFGGNASSLFLASGLKWVPLQKTSVSIDASQDFDTTAANQSSKVGSLTIGVTQTLDQNWSVDGSVAYTHSDYTGLGAANSRVDDNYRIRGRVTYAVTTNVTLDASVGYGKVDSTNAFSTYDRVNAGVGVTASF